MTAGRAAGAIAAGHETSARHGAEVLRAGGNAVDAALAAMLASFTCEPLLTGLGAGGYMLVIAPGEDPVVLDFFVDAPGRGAQPDRAPVMDAVEVSFGHAVQLFNGGPASAGVYGVPAGLVEASSRFGRLPLAELVAPAAQLARAGEPLSSAQAYVLEICAGLATLTPEAAALFAPGGRLLRAGERYRDAALGDALELLGAEGAEPFYTGAIATAVADWLRARGGLLNLADLAEYKVVAREPVRVWFRGREVLTNPPSSAGGVLLARTLARLQQVPAPVGVAALVAAMEEAQAVRTAAFLERLNEPGFVEEFLGADADRPARGCEGGAGADAGGIAETGGVDGEGGRLGSTTHIAALDGDGLACSVTTSNGASSGVVVPGTGIHLNNMLGEQDLNPLGFHQHPPGRRLPSMMSPTAVLRDDCVELVLGSAGSNRIRSAIVQTILRVLDDGMTAAEAVLAPRLHYENGAVYAEPGVRLNGLDGRYQRVEFQQLNLFFGGVQAVERDQAGRFWGGGDPRRGGASVIVGD